MKIHGISFCALFFLFTMTTTVVGSLPSAATAGAGAMYIVTDAMTFSVGTCTGGGSDTMVAISNGTSWSCH